ncbi:uncharacterized protein LOC131617355 [Vicia villosa]|uniref:uncharacterized protein LOC131617355 n=1 Tax=Vicia villosa TaxID=3911 RepID=UPI00273AA5B4|nr:uncharacterized protein LOC131617355 [Vicia villosa]
METVLDQATVICSHCDRAIPVANVDLHDAHCSRNLQKCKVCGDMIPKKNAEDHYLTTHAPVSCSLCSETMDRDIIKIHEGENCPKRIVTCDFCEFPLPAVDLAEHQEVCGNRTEMCHLCNKYVRLRERYIHEARCNGIVQDSAVGSSRNVREAERDEGVQQRRQRPRPQNEFSTKRLLFSIAITGIAVILGSFYLQRKADPSEVH